MVEGNASELLRRDVRYGDIRLGVVADLLVDVDSRRIAGLDVRCPDDVNRFLPLGAGRIEPDGVRVDSALVLMEDGFYRKRARSLAELRGRPVRRGAREIGVLQDLVLDEDATVTALLVATRTGPVELPLDAAVVVGAEALRPAV